MDEFDKVRAERKELDILLDKGMHFTVEKKSALRYFGKKERKFVIRQPYLGTLDKLSSIALGMEINENKIQEDTLGEVKRLSVENVKKCSEYVAVAVLNSGWKIKLFSKILSKYFLWRLNPSKLFEIVYIINQLSNFLDFTNSIRLISATRTTAPKQDLVEG